MVETSSSVVFDDPSYSQRFPITLATAEYRNTLLADVAYTVDLVLPKGEWFAGRVLVTFNLIAKPSQELFLDFRGVKIGEYCINGESVVHAEPARVFKDHRVLLPTAMLNVGGTNTVSMVFLTKYRYDSSGLHSFTDGRDG